MLQETLNKYKALQRHLQKTGRMALAFSGGTDSSFLLQTAVSTGTEILALTVRTSYMPSFESDEAVALCRELNVPHRLLDLSFPAELSNNPPERCYLCKKDLFGHLWQEARKAGFRQVADGSNRDDDPEHRPGMKALKELNVISPLREAGLGKQEIRLLAGKFGWKFWDKPAYSCLMTRLPHNQPVTGEKLRRVDRAEAFLREKGYREVRVRLHGSIARIETSPGKIQELAAEPGRKDLVKALKEIGFQHVCLDLEGYRSGSMSNKG